VPSAELLSMPPTERADVIADIRRASGQTLVVRNTSPRKPVSTPAPSLTAVMQIRVGTTVTRPGPAAAPPSLPGRAASLPDPVKTRFITLNEVAPETAGWFLNLNGVDFEAPGPTETPRAGTVEDWTYINLTPDTHPMHTHLVTHQVIGRTPFDAAAYQVKYGGPDGVPGGIARFVCAGSREHARAHSLPGQTRHVTSGADQRQHDPRPGQEGRADSHQDAHGGERHGDPSRSRTTILLT